jgi:type I restriction enzyme S subunit
MSKDAKNVPALRFKGYSDAWEKRKSKALFSPSSQKGRPNLPVVSVTQDSGVVFRDKMDINIDYDRSTLGSYKVVKPGDFIISLRSFQGGFELSDKVGITSPAYTIFNFKKPEEHFSDFWKYLFKRYLFVQSLKSVTFGIRDGRSISFKDFSDLNIIFPSSKKEEETISRLLGLIDDLIAATQYSIDALEQAKKALLQRLFDQSWRFKGHSDPWEKRKLGDVVERVTRKNRDLVSTRPLTISAQDGLVDQRKFFSKTVASKNISNYFLLKAGDFAYNKSYSVGYPWGAVKRLDKYPSGVLSTLYIVFKPKKINSQFLVTYFEGTTWYVSVSKVASEGARNHGLLNISASDFFDQQLFFPTKKAEQESIGFTIKVLDDLIAATQSRLSSLELLKKSLLQDLFI